MKTLHWECATCKKILYGRYSPCDCPDWINPEEFELTPEQEAIRDKIRKRREEMKR